MDYLRKSVLKYVLIASFTFLFASCGNSNNENVNQEQDSKKEAEQHNEAKFGESGEKDAHFLVEAATMNFNEIQLGNLAEAKAVKIDVKNLGKTLEDAHSKAQADLITLAEKKGITIPTTTPEETNDEYKSLMDKDPKNFDLKYVDMMVKDHTDAISKFEKATTDCEDAEVRDWASKMLPTLREHLDLAMNCQSKLKSE